MSGDAVQFTGDYRTDLAKLVDFIRNITNAVGTLAVRMDAVDEKKNFDVRLAALKAAHEHICGLPTQQAGNRGYADNALKGEALVSQELRIAHYLLGGNRGD